MLNSAVSAAKATTLYLVRHAETEANVSAVWYGSLDAPLTPVGKEQIAATAELFGRLSAEAPFDVIYTSPLPRARATAAAIVQAIAPISNGAADLLRIDDDLTEFTIGDWEGRSFEELRTVEGMWQRWLVDPEFAPPNGESPASFNRRALSVLRRIVAAHPGERVVVVSHGGLICNVLAVWLGNGPADWRRFEVHNCSVTLLQGNDETWQSLAIGDVKHLEPKLVALHDSSAWNR